MTVTARLAGQPPSAPVVAAAFVGTTLYVNPTGSDTSAGTLARPVRTIQRGVELANRVNMAGDDAVVSIAPGVYREEVTIGGLTTARTLTLQGAGANTVLTGADDWSTGWIPQGDGSFVHPWAYKWGLRAVPDGWADYWNWDGNARKRDILRRSEMVYVNGAPLRGVLALADLSEPGTFYVDEGASRLHMRLPVGANLPGALVELGMRKAVLMINGRNNVVLRNLAVMRNRGALQDAAVQMANLQNLRLDAVRIQWSAATGLGSASIDGLRIHESTFSDNGIYGHSDFRSRNVLVEDSEVSRNNWRGWGAELKGFDTVYKWSETRDVTIRRSRFTDNLGHGIWFDGDNQRITIEDNFVARNGRDGIGRGIFLELNGGPITVQRNRICGNGEGGVADGRSNNVSLLNNEVFDNAYYQIEFTGSNTPLSMTDWQTRRSYMVSSSDWTISGNKIKGGPLPSGANPNECYPGPCGWIIWTPDGNHYSEVARTLTADRNQYYYTAGTKVFRVPDNIGQAVSFATWRNLMSAAKGNEANSTFADPGPMSCTPQF